MPQITNVYNDFISLGTELQNMCSNSQNIQTRSLDKHRYARWTSFSMFCSPPFFLALSLISLCQSYHHIPTFLLSACITKTMQVLSHLKDFHSILFLLYFTGLKSALYQSLFAIIILGHEFNFIQPSIKP